MTLIYVWLKNMSKCPNWNETRSRSVALPYAWIYQVSNQYVKNAEKSKEIRKQSKTHTIAKIPEIRFFRKTELTSRSIQRATDVSLKDIYLDLWGHDCEKWVWPTFGCKLSPSDPIATKLILVMSCYLLNIYTKFQSMLKKSPENSDRRMDGRTLPRHNRSVFLKQAYK